MAAEHALPRFGVLDVPDTPFPRLIERWRLLEDLGFDYLWAPDHTANPLAAGGLGPLFDGWTALTAMAAHTRRIRVGTLVTNPILRHPAVLARQAAAVDNLSGGRPALGIGTGIAGFDHAAIGSHYWSPGERAGRFAEYVGIVADILSADGSAVPFAGTYYATTGARATPGPLQRPRPPITVGGQSPTVLRVAASHADCWNTHGPFGAAVEKVLDVTRQQNKLLDEQCAARGRPPSSLRRSLLLVDALDAWASPDALERIVDAFWSVGVREFTVIWPGDDRRRDVERAATKVVPKLRANLTTTSSNDQEGVRWSD